MNSSNAITIREARLDDIPSMHVVRMAVTENRLNNPALVTPKDYEDYITTKGKGWVAEAGNQLIGFAIVDVEKHNVWALFVDPQSEGKGAGKKLHECMMQWYFQHTKETIWLSTAVGTRAETFYRMNGWKEAGMYNNMERRFEMSYEDWKKVNGG